MTDLDRDRRIVRRALAAGAIVWAVLGGVLVAPALGAGLGGQEAAAMVFLALCFGLATSSIWLLLALALDAYVGARIGRRRLVWTAGMVVCTMISPMLVLGAQGAASA